MGAGGARRPSTVVLGLVALVTLSLWANHQRTAARVHRDNLLNGIATAAADGAPEVEARGQLLIEPEVGFAVGMPTKQDVELQALLRAITTKLADATRQLAQLNIAGTNPTARANRIAVLVALEAASQAGAGVGGDGAGMRVGDLASERRPASFAICLSDATDAQITEIKVLLKSMLYMAPPPGAIEAMTLYIVVSDTESLGMIQDMIDESKLIGSRWALRTRIEVYDVSVHCTDMWVNFIRAAPLRHFRPRKQGNWWRIMLPWILPASVEHIIYVDTDVWFRDSWAAMWLERPQSQRTMFQWDLEARTTGAMVLNLHAMRHRMWQAYGVSVCQAFRESGTPVFTGPNHDIPLSTADQAFMQTIAEANPDVHANLSAPHSIHASETWRHGENWSDLFEGGVLQHHNDNGVQTKWPYQMLYFPKVEYAGRNRPTDPNQIPDRNLPIWRTCIFFADLPWQWLRYHASVLCRSLMIEGRKLEYHVTTIELDHEGYREAKTLQWTYWNRSLAVVNSTKDCHEV